MKNILYYSCLISFCIAFSSCEDKVVRKYKANVPVYMTKEEIRTSVKMETRSNIVEIKKTGKIYAMDSLIFIGELHKGVHIINNIDPTKPIEIVFIEIPGNVDIAIKGNTLFGDSYMDLVAIDIENLTKIKEIARVKDVFQIYNEQCPQNDLPREYDYSQNGIIVDWKIKEVEKEIENNISFDNNEVLYGSNKTTYTFDVVSAGNSINTGVAGSMARFAIRNDALYMLDRFNIRIMDISTLTNPVQKSSVTNNNGIETIFLYENYMYIGSNNGMSIYNISNVFTPQLVSNYSHFTACDPVVVDGNYAYVTLRSGTRCNFGLANQLDVIDISDKSFPRLLKSYQFKEPHGLGVSNDILFLCDGPDGLKVFDIKDKLNIDKFPIAHFSGIQATDVIPLSKILLMIGTDGLYQYDYSNLTNIQLLSKIKISE